MSCNINCRESATINKSSTGRAGILIKMDSQGNLLLAATSQSDSRNMLKVVISGGGIKANQWNHIVVVRENNTFKGAVNGIFGTAYTAPGSLLSNSADLVIGGEDRTSDVYMFAKVLWIYIKRTMLVLGLNTTVVIFRYI